MLIIFDLDDTLIDTSNCITPKRLENAFFSIKKDGFLIEDEKLKELLKIDKTSLSAKDSLNIFLKKYGGINFLKKALFEVYDNKNLDMDIFPHKGVTKILSELKELTTICLVTYGNSDIQLLKMKKAGIDYSIFSIMKFLQANNKGKAYLEIIKKLGFDKKDVIVCGDRFEKDLKPAVALGLKTIHMKKGRGKNSMGKVDYEVSSFKEVRKIVFKYLGEKDDNK